MEQTVQTIFRLEYHPVNGHPRRVTFLLSGPDEILHRVTERRTQGTWREIDREQITYFEYSDQ